MTAVRRRRRRAADVVLAVIAIAAAAACSCSALRFDREGAVERVQARFDGRLSRAQAECYVDRVVNELGTGALDTDSPPPEVVPRLTRIRTDCIGVTSLGATVVRTDTTRPARAPVPGPRRPGDDPALDALHARCTAGSGAACDQLFDEAPLGSEYEEHGLSCGGRGVEPRCADRYPG